MHFNNERDLVKLLITAERQLFSSAKKKFANTISWRNDLPNSPGVYALYENEQLLYIGETGNLRERMNEINRTVNHSFRKQLGHLRYGGIKSRKKFAPDVEENLNSFFNEKLFIQFIEVNFGRLEIETFIITRYQEKLINSEKKRKLKISLDVLEEASKL